jgi:glucan phosphorylase
MAYPYKERYRIQQKAKKKIGALKDYDDWMDNCISNMMASGAASDEDEAEAICEVIWEDINED